MKPTSTITLAASFTLMLSSSSLIIIISFAEEVTVRYCSNQRYSIDYHPILESYIPLVLEQMHQGPPRYSMASDIKHRATYPPTNPLVYASSFCKKGSPSECKQCLRTAKKKLLHECVHEVGGQVYSELCFMRFELYDFFS